MSLGQNTGPRHCSASQSRRGALHPTTTLQTQRPPLRPGLRVRDKAAARTFEQAERAGDTSAIHGLVDTSNCVRKFRAQDRDPVAMTRYRLVFDHQTRAESGMLALDRYGHA